MKKYRPPLTTNEKKELERLSKIDFSNFNEPDIREEFLVSLLRILGYQKDLDYSISREEIFKLNPLFLQVGRDRIKLDYICSLRKEYFWIIEAKNGICPDIGNPPVITIPDIAQAHFYSLHPQINCKYFIVSNGWYTNLYDRDNLDNDLNPLISIKSRELPERFLEIDKFVGSTQLSPHLKENLLVQIEKVLGSEILIDRIDEFIDEVRNTCSKVRPIVLNNFRKQSRNRDEIIDERINSYLTNIDLKDIPFSIFLGLRTLKEMSIASDIIIKRLQQDQKHSKQYLFFHKIFLKDLTSVNYLFYLNVLFFLLKLNESDIENINYPEDRKVKLILDEWVELLIFHFGKRMELRLLWSFEGLLYRLNKRLILPLKIVRDVIKKKVDNELFLLPEEEIALSRPLPGIFLIELIENSVLRGLDTILRKHFNPRKREFNLVQAYQEYDELYKITNEIEIKTNDEYKKLQKELGGVWQETLGFDTINHYVDILGSGTCGILLKFPSYTKSLNSEIIDRMKILFKLKCTSNMEDIGKLFNVNFNDYYKDITITKDTLEDFFNPGKNPYDFHL